MSYRYYAPKRNPVAMWMMDDPAPFNESTGLGYTATMVTGASATPDKHASLCAGLDYAPILGPLSRVEFDSPVFVKGRETETFALEAWVLIAHAEGGRGYVPQQILSHQGIYDGLIITGKVIEFITAYESPVASAVCRHRLPTHRKAHVVGVHTADENLLYVNGELVSKVQLTEAQKNAKFITSNGKLYSGATDGQHKLAINGVAMYRSVSPDVFYQNWDAGNRVVPKSEIIPQFAGTPIRLHAGNSKKFIEYTWDTDAEFKGGLFGTGVKYSNNKLYLQPNNGYGNWRTGMPLDANVSSLHSVVIDWDGYDVSVQTSIDGGANWLHAWQRRPIQGINVGDDPNTIDLEIRVGLQSDDAYLSSLSITGFTDNVVENIQGRVATIDFLDGHHENATRGGDFEPNMYRDDNGLRMWDSSFNITADTDSVVTPFRTVEAWVKPTGQVVDLSSYPLVYVNGEPATTLDSGRWSLLHFVYGSDQNIPTGLAGKFIIGSWTYYPNSLTQDQCKYIYQSYTGRPVIKVEDNASMTISEPASPVKIYSNSWSVEGGGG